jgi:hypothetical protein
MKCFVILVITGATGTAAEELKKYQETISGKHSVTPL